MITPATPVDEATRIGTLRALDILDTAPEERFDRLTRLAKRLFGVPIALVSLIDTNRQWFKSCDGLSVSETSREISFCGHAILSDDILLIPDALLDERFSDNPLVVNEPHIRFYAGCPLRAPNGSRLGTLCLIDREPRMFDAVELEPLRDLAHMAEQELAAVQLATTDELTQLSNRRGFTRLAEHALSLCRRIGTPASLLFLDLDRFKQINDTRGHPNGDVALREVARLVRSCRRRYDTVARCGGDEFALILAGARTDDAVRVAERVRASLKAHGLLATHSQGPCQITASFGVASFPDDGPDKAAIVAAADRALYAAKARGGNAVCCAEDASQSSSQTPKPPQAAHESFAAVPGDDLND